MMIIHYPMVLLVSVNIRYYIHSISPNFLLCPPNSYVLLTHIIVARARLREVY